MNLTKEKIWQIKTVDQEQVSALATDLKVNNTLCELLVQRGIFTYDTAKDFFRPQMSHLHDPMLMLGMDKAIERIDIARQQQERVMVYGDYDVDGTTSVAIVFDFLQQHYPQAEKDLLTYYIPHRYTEGYGLSMKGIDAAQEMGCTLIITLDCGTKAIDKIAYANTLGIDIIVCDHHTPGAQMPAAYAMLNPKQEGCNYPFKELSACGIGFKLISALATFWALPEEATHQYLDLVATSIAADIVPIIGENRILAFYGLKRANEQPNLALSALRKQANFKEHFTISDLVFIISPRINAAGRMGDAKKAVSLFIAKTEEEAAAIASSLQIDNEDRREIDKQTTLEALDLLRDEVYISRKSTIVFKDDWHKGVVGIVASRLIDHYYKPTIVLTTSNGKATGSARSVWGFNIHDAIQQCEDLLDNFGGHFFAAGMTLPIENIPLFVQKFEDVVSATISEASMQPRIEVDAVINLEQITNSFFNTLQQFQPFGPLNMRPIFMTKDVQNKYSKLVKEEHIKFDIEQNGKRFTGIGFNMKDKFPLVQSGTFDIVYHIDENEWQGVKTLQLRILDIK